MKKVLDVDADVDDADDDDNGGHNHGDDDGVDVDGDDGILGVRGQWDPIELVYTRPTGYTCSLSHISSSSSSSL